MRLSSLGFTPQTDLRRSLIDAHITRRLLALSSLGALFSALLPWWWTPGPITPAQQACTLVWVGFSAFAALLGLWSDRRASLVSTLLLAGGILALLADAVFSGHAVKAPALVGLPLALLLSTLLLSPAAAVTLTALALVGLLGLAMGWPSGIGSGFLLPWSHTGAHLFHLMAGCVVALGVGRLVVARFSEQAQLSRRHEYRYRDLFDRIPSAVVLHDDGRVIDANRAALNLFGLERRDDLMGTNLRQLIPDGEAQTAFNQRLEQLHTAPVGQLLPPHEIPMRRADGRLIQVRATAAALHDLETRPRTTTEAGPLPRPVLSFLFDDTERHRAQAEAARARLLINAIIDHSPYAVALSRREDGAILECNAAYLRILGRKREEVLNRTTIALGMWSDLQDRQRILDSLQAQAEGPVSENTLTLRRANGQLRTVRGTFSQLSIDGQDHILFIARDLTDTLLRDAVHEAVVDTAPVGLAVTYDGQVMSANPEIHRIFRLKPGGMLGRTTRQLWTDLQAHDERQVQVHRAFSSGGVVSFEQDFRLGADVISARIQGRLVSSSSHDKHTVVWIVRDVTQERRDAQALRDAARRADEANRAKSIFLANMSHELRTPLNGILGLLDMALDDQEQAQPPRHHIELARESARLLSDLVNDVLDLAKIEAGRLELHEEPFDLHGLLSSLEAVYRVIAEARGLFLRFDATETGGLPQWVRGDALRVRQILGNYLSNALKFTESGGVELMARWRASDDLVRFEVRDSGAGIDQAIQERLFQPFEQGDASPTRRQGGTGLGLAICRQLAELMGGRVGVTSAPGHGSCFWVEMRLPAHDRPAGVGPVAGQRMDFSGLHLLVADDNPVNVLITDAMLKRAGARVTCVGDGQAAIAAVQAAAAQGDSVHAVLMDIQMPGLDGLDATRLLRQSFEPEQLPIIALTAGALQSERDAALAAGMNDFVTKPVDRERLLACVARWSGREPVSS